MANTSLFRSEETRYALMLLIPALIIICIVVVFPLIYSFGLSFTNKYVLSPNTKFIGFRNYILILSSSGYWQILGNTIIIAFGSVAVMTTIAMSMALLLNKTIKGIKLFRGLALMSWAVPALAAAMIWKLMLNQETGIINYLLNTTGITENSIPWVTHEVWAKIAICFVFAWRGTPFLMVIFLAALKTIPSEIIDAAKIDGASAISRFRHITIPIIRPIIMIATLLLVIMIFQNYEIIMQTTEGGPANGTKTLAIRAYELAFNSWRMGRATAVGITWLLFLFVFSLLYMRFVGGRDQKIF